MKTSKAPTQSLAKEDCDVWLDTVQLKGKAKQKRVARPISKLLNPFSDGGGYNLAVALNFTQTKMEMPKTKQSSLSTFFTPYRRVLHKSSEVPNRDGVKSLSSCTLTASTTTASERKRKHDACLEKSDLYESDTFVDCKRESGKVLDAPSLNMYCESEEKKTEECKSPEGKRRLTDASLLRDESQSPPQTWSQDPLFTCSQFPESELYPLDQQYTTEKNVGSSETSFLGCLQSEEAFGKLIDVKGRTSTQKLLTTSTCQMDEDKENSRSLSSDSPFKNSSFSHHGSPSDHRSQKHTGHLWNKAGKEVCFGSELTQRSSSPLKKLQQRSREVDDDSLAMLFTQDSEGFRVIAHRGLQTRSPLKDQSNLNTGMVRTSAYKPAAVEEEDEDDMLFTQDSQGNMVIKH
ncbi:LOW QUALITY PROTEIN: uncharacterized protein LOC133461512 [Cololabis saira]|uniref:LOW QUALITY PROTEIN: uncharacterized protein LOC133461512 n=1 Tax=Cololabis saira TaxID=129043 RepID=UPI002AD2529B|nr:LOW QUALITY PROTEIN: uncharacterized protein LOC133461512 [Cololabis saira]